MINKKKTKTYFFMGKGFLFALGGGWLFSVLHIPIPWLLGPMTGVLLAPFVIKQEIIWPISFRNFGLVIVGYTIGLSMTKNSLVELVNHLPSMFLMTSLIMVMSSILAIFISKWGRIDYLTALTSSIPGGLSQILMVADETDEIDLTTVTFFHVIRILLVVFIVPFIIYGPFLPDSHLNQSPDLPEQISHPFSFILIFLIGICLLVAKGSSKIRLPGPFFLGPVILMTVLNLFGYSGTEPPDMMVDFSQLLIGGYIGTMLKPKRLKKKKKIAMLALTTGLVLVLTALVSAYLFAKFYQIELTTGFLSLAPGGMDQMSIIAREVNADVTTVTSYQLFRVIFILVAVPPFLKAVVFWERRKKERNTADM